MDKVKNNEKKIWSDKQVNDLINKLLNKSITIEDFYNIRKNNEKVLSENLPENNELEKKDSTCYTQYYF